ncbi:hypothetical protein COV42_02270 [Candidatus Campbellbacteria bacterium CG11_big_fil_rev_8_21_14_0_20_44_21]|uniref:Glutamyl-tRNA amidotransferase n=1 Tax=Candidatus Campbellbacteria bacterium CG22_combo_CG10-13_8_21_14_all_43_18 TaxID=1974530 RepID=A0A2H0DXT8_9BACT|nr:MAG: hypothetical protein COW82_02270 [Candidatus Campbellbacteria bacterium CG22_combo_CG10-13_8_21_14_all_43_18]PIR24166.1 MAG: hypothetical protein COV42_02270 [Candidatus Campbellbacteria bacterium CG11_big_fil_rev_8_21_14_0_20_44_21]
MTIQDKIREHARGAMKARDETRTIVLRSIISGFTNYNVAKKRKPDHALSPEEVMEVISREGRQRKDSIEQFEKGERFDLVEKEKAELKIIEEYLPEQLTDEEIEKIVVSKKEELGIADKSGLGRLMGAVMKETKGRADGNRVKKIVEKNL